MLAPNSTGAGPVVPDALVCTPNVAPNNSSSLTASPTAEMPGWLGWLEELGMGLPTVAATSSPEDE